MILSLRGNPPQVHVCAYASDVLTPLFPLLFLPDGELYSATVSDFSGSDPLIYKEPLRTDQSDSKHLNCKSTTKNHHRVKEEEIPIIFVPPVMRFCFVFLHGSMVASAVSLAFGQRASQFV